MKIRDIVNLKEFDPVVDLSWAGNINEQERMLANYIMTEQLAATFVDILESLNLVRSEKRREEKSGDVDTSATKRSHIISGQYGTGKSYFLLMLNVILSMENKNLTDMMIEKFSNFPELQYQLKVIRDRKRYFVVRINGEAENEKEFKDVIQEAVIEALEDVIDEVCIETAYNKTLIIVDSIYEKNKADVDNYLKNKDFDFYDLRAGLSQYKKSYLKEAEELCLEVLSFKPKIEIDSLKDFLKNVNKILDDNGYGELVIIFDEFSAYITASMENGRIGIDLGSIQTLAQLSSKAFRDTDGIKVSLITSTHKDLTEMVEKSGTSKKEELDKVFGRFDTHNLSFDQGEELLKNTIEVSDWNFQRITSNHFMYISHLERTYGRNFKDFYPLHPLTVNYLEPISQLYAQKTRTTFGFLKEVVKENFFNREAEENGKLNLVTLSDLYDHFESSIDSKHPEIVNVFNQNYNDLRKDSTLVDFLKALTITHSSSYTKSSAHTELSAEELKDIYQLPNEEFIREKLNPVVNSNHLNITTNEGKYRLFVNNSGINLDKLISENMDKVAPYRKLKEILEKSSSRIFIREHYNLKYNMGLYPFDRKMTGHIVTLDQLESNDILRTTRILGDNEASITFLVPEFRENFDKDDVVEKYKEIMRDLPNNICLAIPNSLIFNPEELKEYGAMQIIERENEEIIKNEELRKILVKRRRKLEDKIRNKYLRKFANLRNFTFIFSNGRVKDDIRQDMALYKEIFFNYYTKFPHEITVENFNTKAGVTDIDKIFINGGVGEVAKTDTSAGSKQVYNTLIPLGLVAGTVKAGKTEFSFKAPTELESALSKEIWDIITAPETNITLEDKVSKLLKAPYGLNRPLLMLYLYVATKRGSLIAFEKVEKRTDRTIEKKPVILDLKKLGELVDKPEKFELQKNETDKSYPEELKIIWLKFNELKIIPSSKARNFRIDGRNEFNVFSILGSEMKSIYTNLSEKEVRLSKKSVNTGKLKTLVNKLHSAIRSFRPEELEDAVINLPAIFKNPTYKENLEEFLNFIDSLKKLTGPEVGKFEDSINLLEKLNYVIKDLSGFSDMKEEFEDLTEKLKIYKSNFLDLPLLDNISERTGKLLLSYNNELKRRHDIYHNNLQNKTRQLLEEEGTKLDTLKILSEIKIPNVSFVADLIEEIESSDNCEITIYENEISQCRLCKVSDLKSVEMAARNLDSNFNSYHRKIVGIFDNYLERLRDPSVRERFSTNDEYRNLIFALGRIESGNTQGNELMVIREAAKKLKDLLNSFFKERDSAPIEREKIELVDLENSLKLELQALGKNYVSLDEIESKFNKILNELREKNIKTAKI